MQESVWDAGLGQKYLFALPRKWIWNIPGRAFSIYPDECVPSRRWVILITYRCCLFVEAHFLDFRSVRGILRKQNFPVWCSLPLVTRCLIPSMSCSPNNRLTESLRQLEPCRIALFIGPRDSGKRHLWQLLNSHKAHIASKKTSNSSWVRSSADVRTGPPQHYSLGTVVAGHNKTPFTPTSCLQQRPQVSVWGRVWELGNYKIYHRNAFSPLRNFQIKVNSKNSTGVL